MDQKTYLQYWSALYRADLTDNILPFWLEHGLDRKHGGIYTCLDREGKLMDPTKSVWFQGRFAFVCSFAYNQVERRPEWLDAARQTLDFIEQHCFDADGRMYFEVAADGTPLRMRRYVFSESFAAIAMAEYALATGNQSYAEKALKIFKDMRRFLTTPGLLAPKYLPSVEAQGHAITMIMINVASRLKKVIADPELDRQIDESLFKLKNDFMHPEFKVLLETVGPAGEFIDTCNGPRRRQDPHCPGPDYPELGMGLGLGRNLRRHHQFPRLSQSAPAGLLAGHEVLVAANGGHHCQPLCLQTDRQ